MSMTHMIKWLPPSERRWAVGSGPAARLVHRMVGHWPGNDAIETACRNTVSLHAEGPEAKWWGSWGGRSYDSIEDVPEKYLVCLKCVAADETVE